MKKILLLHGPNLNLLGQRDKNHYGALTLTKIENMVKREAKKNGFSLICFQSNHEGFLIDRIQKLRGKVAGIIINPGALTHYSYALHDTLVDSSLPCVEVHLSNIKTREKWRQVSVTGPACKKVIYGKKERGYLEALNELIKFL